MFVGRKSELKLMEEAYHTAKDELVVLYGRRRIGKSSLVKHFAEKKSSFYEFEALEGEMTHRQIEHFSQQLQNRSMTPSLIVSGLKIGSRYSHTLRKRFSKEKPEQKKSCFSMSCRGWPQVVADWFHFSNITGTTIGKAGMSC